MRLISRQHKSSDILLELIQAREVSRLDELDKLAADIVALQAAKRGFKEHDKVRRKAEDIYREALAAFLTAAEEQALRKKKDKAALIALFLMLMLWASQKAYAQVNVGLARSIGGVAPMSDESGRQFAEGRQGFLHDFPDRVFERLDKAAQEAQSEGEDEGGGGVATKKAKKVKKARIEIETGDGNRLAETEAQITYGIAIDKLFKMAGYTTKRWITQNDERVRPTHWACQDQGSIDIDGTFSNGLRFPGDPEGDISEIANCRCVLLPGGVIENYGGNRS